MITTQGASHLAGEAGIPKNVVGALRQGLAAARFRMATACQGAVVPHTKT